MKNRYVLRSVVVLLASSVVLLSACSSKKNAVADANNAYGSFSANTNTDGGAKAYAVAQSASYQKDTDGFMINPMTAPANQTYYFAFDNSTMRPQDMKALLVQANYLAANPQASVRLEGNTDERGSREYNIGLGWRRDQTVARILEQQGVRPNQIEMVSYGKQNPVVTGNDEHSWALNRRVVMIYK